MKTKKLKYQKKILPIVDLLIINTISYLTLKNQDIEISFYIFISVIWISCTVITKFYKTYRFTGWLKLLRATVNQLSISTIGYFSYFGIFKEGVIINSQFLNICLVALIIATLKLLSFYFSKIYRKSGKNSLNIIFVGKDETCSRIIKMFKNQKDLGYNYKGFFSDEEEKSEYFLGTIDLIKSYIIKNPIDEIYIALSIIKTHQIKKLTQIADENKITLKLVPNADELYLKNRISETYNDQFRIIKIKEMPFESKNNKILKRIFDIIFSLLAIVFVMSWLTPILWVLIKLESKGPLLFKQEREGLNGKKFICFKFRSMLKNQNANKIHATKNDVRVTKIGKFIRKTSIDELPQFYNVFLGDMSVVGPRPHMESLALEYEKVVDNYIDRHAVKPGITGLAQVSGYRGEIIEEYDIKNRIRFDIFYIENWSFWLDLKIILKTILNVFKGDENAY